MHSLLFLLFYLSPTQCFDNTLRTVSLSPRKSVINSSKCPHKNCGDKIKQSSSLVDDVFRGLWLQNSKGDDDILGDSKSTQSNDILEDDMNIELLPLMDGEELSDEILAQLEEGQPSELAIMKDLLGINGFTYILAALIVTFLSLNAFLGPGWLGQMLGLEGTGTFTQISDSLPGTVDLNLPENLL